MFVIITASTILAVDYDEILARYKLYPMASAAFGNNPELCVKDNFANATFIGQYTLQCNILTNDNCSGFIAVSHSDKAIIIAFSYQQILIEGGGALLILVSSFPGGGLVNKYFLDSFNKIWNAGMGSNLSAVINSYSDYEVWVTGHSLGAALSSIAAATISYSKYTSPEKIKLVDSGQPRTGDINYVNAVNNLVPYSFRIVHAHDLIADLPPKGILNLGYYHHKAEVWYNNDMTFGTNYTICESDGDQNCSDGQLNLNFNDHLFYFNTSYAFAVDGCPGYNPYH